VSAGTAGNPAAHAAGYNGAVFQEQKLFHGKLPTVVSSIFEFRRTFAADCMSGDEARPSDVGPHHFRPRSSGTMRRSV
jgi:hypothetical protein